MGDFNKTDWTPFSGSRYVFDRQVELDVLNGTRPDITYDTPGNISSNAGRKHQRLDPIRRDGSATAIHGS